mmetsp:Transcript_3624/g.3032  ORF Transcript_3624/g.3032 Transcript_3624/m.3032 type:complete len:81 (+) Transcript_3624:76-318(+)
MVKFVQTFKNFLLNNVDANTMAEIAPIGLSFDVEHIDQEYIKEGLGNQTIDCYRHASSLATRCKYQAFSPCTVSPVGVGP